MQRTRYNKRRLLLKMLPVFGGGFTIMATVLILRYTVLNSYVEMHSWASSIFLAVPTLIILTCGIFYNILISRERRLSAEEDKLGSD